MERFIALCFGIICGAVAICAVLGALLALGATHEWWECKGFSKKYAVAVEWNAFHGCYVPELDMYTESIKGEK